MMKKTLVVAVAVGALVATVGTAVAADDTEAITKLSKDKAKMAEAQKTWNTICAACHGPQGAGLVGPNLTDNFWLKGNKPTDIQKSIITGNPAKGMPPMMPQLGPDGVKMMSAYVLTLKGKNLPGKPPEGVEAK